MQNNEPISYIQQGEINIRELSNLLINSKKLIIVVTLFFSLMATIYTYSLKPKYEAISVMEVPLYFNEEGNPIYIQHPLQVVEELTIKFIKIPNNKTGNSAMYSIGFLGKKFIEIKSISASPDKAIKNVENVQQYMINYLQEIESSKTKIQNDIDIDSRKSEKYELKIIGLTNLLQTETLYLDEFKTLLKEVEETIKISESSDYDLNTRILLLGEKRELSNLISNKMNLLEDFNSEIKELKSLKINTENRIQRNLDKFTQQKSSFNTDSEITTKQLPTKKLLVITASFVAGFFLSIFFVLIRQAFLQEQK